MKIVFYPSQPLDLRPVIAHPFHSEFQVCAPRLFEDFQQTFTDCDLILLQTDGILTIPQGFQTMRLLGRSLFEHMLLVASYFSAQEEDPLLLFVPTFIEIDDFETFAEATRELMQNDWLSSFISAVTVPEALGAGEKHFFAQGTLLHKSPDLRVYAVDTDAISAMDSRQMVSPGMFFVPVSSWVASLEEDALLMFWDCEEIWKTEKNAVPALQTYLQQSKRLGKPLPIQTLCPIQSATRFRQSWEALMEQASLDTHENWVEGQVELHNVEQSIIWNRGDTPLLLEGMRQVLVLSNGHSTRIVSLQPESIGG